MCDEQLRPGVPCGHTLIVANAPAADAALVALQQRINALFDDCVRLTRHTRTRTELLELLAVAHIVIHSCQMEAAGIAPDTQDPVLGRAWDSIVARSRPEIFANGYSAAYKEPVIVAVACLVASDLLADSTLGEVIDRVYRQAALRTIESARVALGLPNSCPPEVAMVLKRHRRQIVNRRRGSP